MRACEGYGIICWKLRVIGLSGLPDRLLLYRGRAAFLELKRPGAKPQRHEKRQAWWREKLNGAGFRAGVVDNARDAERFAFDFSMGRF